MVNLSRIPRMNNQNKSNKKKTVDGWIPVTKIISIRRLLFIYRFISRFHSCLLPVDFIYSHGLVVSLFNVGGGYSP
jgi:hypothetical protein